MPCAPMRLPKPTMILMYVFCNLTLKSLFIKYLHVAISFFSYLKIPTKTTKKNY